jgi:hypothetical protein
VLTYTHFLQSTILSDNDNQFKVGLETDNGHFTLKVRTVTLMSHFFAPNSTTCPRTPNSIQSASIFTNFLSGVLSIMRSCTIHRNDTTFRRLIRAKFRLKIEDNRLHSNGEVKHRDLRGDFQQSQPISSATKMRFLVGCQHHTYSFRNARNREDAAQRLQRFMH